jgi:SAM-dependent methyltransferase
VETLDDTDAVTASAFDLGALVGELASRSSTRTEADIQAGVRDLLLYGGLNLSADDLRVQLEAQVGDRRRIDVEAGFTVIEVKKDLRSGTVLAEAIAQLGGYVATRTEQLAQRYVGILTDGADWRCYRLGPSGGLEEVTRHEVNRAQPDTAALCVWLEAILATQEAIKPTPREIDRRIGADSPGHALERATLRDLWLAAQASPEVRLKRRLWARLLTTAFGAHFTDDDALFVEHTYLVLTAEVIAHAAVGLVPASIPPSALVTGRRFADVGIHGVAEADFFDWVLSAPGGEAFVSTLARRVARFDWSAVEHDVLKHLYESVIDERQRHQLGEYYTPDWLADLMVSELVSDPLQDRVLDPACGSGTFLFHAVRRYLAAADSAAVDNATALAGVTGKVFGVDVHPVAVILARVTYLLAIGPARLRGKRGELAVPVYLGDSLQWQIDHTSLRDDRLIIYTDDDRGLFTEELVFPASVLADPGSFDRLVRELTDLAARRERGGARPAVRAVLARQGLAPDDIAVLEGTFSLLCDLHDHQRDHIWGYYARNLARPLWLHREEAQVDVVVGNPPWLAYRYMTEEMQKVFRVKASARGLWAGAKVATHQDLSAYFAIRSIELYLRPGGRFGFVMPLAVLSRLAYAGFREGSYGPEFGVEFDEPWDCEGVKPALFPVPSSVVFGRKTDGQARALPRTCRRWSGRLPAASAATWAAASEHLTSSSGTTTYAGAETTSPYHGRFTQGATVVPRVLHVVEEAPDPSQLGLASGLRRVRSHRSKLEKPPWRDLPDRGPATVESQFIFNLHLGSTVLPYRLLRPEMVVLPVLDGALLSCDDPRIEASPRLADWWREGEKLWSQHRSATTTATLGDWLNYQKKLTGQFPMSPIRFCYTKAGNAIAAAIVTDMHTVIDHKLYWAASTSLEEARYLEAVFNSKTLTERVRPLQSRGLFGPRDVDKYVFWLPIPLYDPDQALHRRLAAAAATAEEVADAVPLPAGMDFKAARQRVRQAVYSHGVGREIDELSASLLADGPEYGREADEAAEIPKE